MPGADLRRPRMAEQERGCRCMCTKPDATATHGRCAPHPRWHYPVALQMRDSHRLTRLALLTAIALVLFLVEASLPRPLPWMRLGLSNAAVLAALLLFGAGPAVAVSLAKLTVGGLLGGGLAGPAFVIGGAASLASVITMALLHRLLPRLFSPVGLSVAGALMHQSAQLTVAAIYLGHNAMFALLPVFLLSGVLTGLPTGLATYFALQRLGKTDAHGA